MSGRRRATLTVAALLIVINTVDVYVYVAQGGRDVTYLSR